MSFYKKLLSILTITIFFTICLSNISLVVKAAPNSLLPTSKVLCSNNTACPITGNRDLSTDGGGVEGTTAFIISIARTITYITAGLAILFLVIGGVRYLISSDEKGVSAARLVIQNSIIGLVVAILAYAIISIVLSVLSGQIVAL
ncbi:MAG: hypothetical protein H7196_00275 [candidate division SR1 bacterium]|nr:hypothetical protein [candidate division SR1 bacterium]